MKGRGVRIIDQTIKESSVFLGFSGGFHSIFWSAETWYISSTYKFF